MATWRKIAFRGLEIRQAKTDLLEIIRALRSPCRFACRLDRREQERDQDANDRDDDQKFDQGKGQFGIWDLTMSDCFDADTYPQYIVGKQATQQSKNRKSHAFSTREFHSGKPRAELRAIFAKTAKKARKPEQIKSKILRHQIIDLLPLSPRIGQQAEQTACEESKQAWLGYCGCIERDVVEADVAAVHIV